MTKSRNKGQGGMRFLYTAAVRQGKAIRDPAQAVSGLL